MAARTNPAPEQRRLPTKGLRHIVDAAVPVGCFLAGYGLAGPVTGAVCALLGGGAVAVVRLLRGDSLKVVVITLGGVLAHSLVALYVGDGRAFFLPELLFNVVLAVVFAGSLLLGRPVSGPLARLLRAERRDWRSDPRRRRLHLRITALWLGLWCAHLVIWLPLYHADNVMLLGAANVVLGKPAATVCGWLTWRRLRRPEAQPPEPAPAP
ncbi:DUF3159 domain-containing protein [Streptomyces pinistramenti]|uniref:DUF3159 domain-containing protein n=1 Tax=Streptomyces pinistramenti TaxID=2884812 RepID=UPI001D07024C|nr:DUF3159 domain-containing protein [Streptomyces pinistramenti]MCB5911569.1 DUF3159 domain-containing protein [Streptomyces pinistramenti]